MANRKLTQLQGGSNYEYQVRASCGNDWSPWSDLQYFTTTGTATRLAAPAQLIEAPTQERDAVETEPAQMGLFPNPTTGWLRVNAMNFVAERLEIVNAAGSLVQSFEGGSQSIDLGALPKGMYCVVAYSTTGERLSKRFVKL